MANTRNTKVIRVALNLHETPVFPGLYQIPCLPDGGSAYPELSLLINGNEFTISPRNYVVQVSF